MPVFYFLVILGVIALWFLLAFVFKPLGRFFRRMWDDTIEVMTEEDKSENKKE